MQVDFYGYAGDCTVSGRLDLAGVRLSEMLEAAEDLVVHDARLFGLDGESAERVGELVLGREDLFAVEAPGGPSSAGRRIHTVRHLVRFICGPYTIIGELHTLPGTPPLRALLTRRSMVPLTNSAIVFERGGAREVRRADVIIVNGWRIDSAEPLNFDDPDVQLLAGLGR